MTRFARRSAALLLGALCLAGCDLTEVTTAPGSDVVVVEAVLRSDVEVQQVLLHRSLDGDFAGGVPGARITITGPAGDEHVLVPGTACYQIDALYAHSDSLDFQGSCYANDGRDVEWVHPGQSYQLTVEVPDGRVIRGRTTVPGAYAVPSLRAASDFGFLCSMAPDSAFKLLWTQSEGAWSYVADLSISGLSQSLAGRGFRVIDPMLVRGISVSQADTTLLLPGEFGVFERLQYDSDLLLAIRDGFPEGTRAELVLAAADRNWVNSIRGASFNPSGLIRISTVVGDGVGVFGSLNIHRASIVVRKNTVVPRCGVGRS
jgi:hypothetical protein